MTHHTEDLPLSLERLTANAELDEETRAAFADVLAALRVHGRELLAYPGVVSVRPGYRFRRGRITPQPAVRVAVLGKHDLGALPAKDLLPRKLGSVVVDVVPANPLEQLEYLRRAQGAEAAGAAGSIHTTFVGDEQALAESAADMALSQYVPPAGTPLNPVTEQMTVICHASPDAGWRNLKEFLLGTTQRLTATMYEFNARHVRDALVSALDGNNPAGTKRLRLILDAGSPHEASGNDISKEEARRSLADALGGRFTGVWAAVAEDNRTTKAFFKNSYHIKVAVRDGESFWLSSGNWKRSGQPVTDPFDPPPNFNGSSFQNGSNREWHVIIHGKELARVFETYIDNDIDQALPLQVPDAGDEGAAPAPPDLFVPDSLLDSFDGSGPVQFFREEAVTGQLTVQPLLTPDNYIAYVQGLLDGAQRRIWFQNQSLGVDTSNARYMKLFRTLRDKSRDDNLDVRILVRGDFNPDAILTRLTNNNFRMERVRLQNGNHNKGIIIDAQTVVLGSHNWTGDGTTLNRDASLVFNDPDIARYYERLFEYDWNRVEHAGDAMQDAMPRVAQPGEPTPAGMTRVGWRELFPE